MKWKISYWVIVSILTILLPGLLIIMISTQQISEQSAAADILAIIVPVLLIFGNLFAASLFFPTMQKIADRQNPFADDLRDAKQLRKKLKGVKGEQAAKERHELDKVIAELRQWPNKLAAHQGERIVNAMKSEIERVKAEGQIRLTAFDTVEHETTQDLKRLQP